MNSCNLTVGISALASALAKNLCNEELALLACAFTQLGDTFNTILAQRALQEKCRDQLCNKKTDASS